MSVIWRGDETNIATLGKFRFFSSFLAYSELQFLFPRIVLLVRLSIKCTDAQIRRRLVHFVQMAGNGMSQAFRTLSQVLRPLAAFRLADRPRLAGGRGYCVGIAHPHGKADAHTARWTGVYGLDLSDHGESCARPLAGPCRTRKFVQPHGKLQMSGLRRPGTCRNGPPVVAHTQREGYRPRLLRRVQPRRGGTQIGLRRSHGFLRIMLAKRTPQKSNAMNDSELEIFCSHLSRPARTRHTPPAHCALVALRNAPKMEKKSSWGLRVIAACFWHSYFIGRGSDSSMRVLYQSTS